MATMTSRRVARASSGVISGSGLAMAKTIGLSAMPISICGVSAPFTERPIENIRALQRFGERTRVGVHGVRALPLIHALVAAAIDDALGVAENDVARIEAQRLGEIETGDAGGARAIADELRVADVPAGQAQRVEDAGGGDDRGAVLIVVEDGNVHQLAQALLDDEAFRRLDVLEIDAAEGRDRDSAPR